MPGEAYDPNRRAMERIRLEPQWHLVMRQIEHLSAEGRWREIDHRKMLSPFGHGTRLKRPE
jgi:hypothetical protein